MSSVLVIIILLGHVLGISYDLTPIMLATQAYKHTFVHINHES